MEIMTAALAMIEGEKPHKQKAKDRDGVYKRRGYWHFDYKDPQTGQWRSKTTGKANKGLTSPQWSQ